MTETLPKPQSPAEVLLSLIISFVAPMFLPAAGGDIHFARAAAIDTINSYRIQFRKDLLTIAQVIAFGLATLGSLSFAMADNLSPSTTLRLRAAAAAAYRASEQCRRAVVQPGFDATSPVPPQDMFPDAATIAATGERAREHSADAADRSPSPQPASPQPAPTTHSKAADAHSQTQWAGVIAEVAAGIPDLSPSQRREALIRAAALSSVAHELLVEAA